MLFQRRDTPNRMERLRVAMWPRRSWGRSFRYYAKRVLRLSGSPHAIAAGVAAGVFASFTPFIGLHFILGFVLAFLFGGNLIAAAFGTAFGNPITFPIIWATTHRVGSWILGGLFGVRVGPPVDLRQTDVLGQFFDHLTPIIGPMVVGAIPLGIPTAIVFYFLVNYSVRGFQRLRRERLEARRRMQPGNAVEGNDG